MASKKAYLIRGERGLEQLRELSAALAQVEQAVLRAHRTRGAIPTRSHHRSALKAHGRRVAARLRVAEGQLATDGHSTLPDLARLLLTVTDRYLEGRIGALLDEGELTPGRLAGVKPVRDREPLRLGAVVAITVAGAFGVAAADLPGPAEGPAIAAVGVLAVILAYRRNARQALEVLAPFGGGK